MTLPIDREEVAKAMFTRRGFSAQHWDAKGLKQTFLLDADAAIANVMEQLQEPSAEVVKVGVDFAFSSSIDHENTWAIYVTGLYKAMIAEALKTQTEKEDQ